MLRQDNGQPFVHLDTLFNPISERQALIHADGIEDKSLHAIEDRFDLLSIDKQEQMYLGTNVLSLGNRAVVSQKMHSRINSKLQERGFSVKAIDFSDALIMQGAFRCATAPMVREP